MATGGVVPKRMSGCLQLSFPPGPWPSEAEGWYLGTRVFLCEEQEVRLQGEGGPPECGEELWSRWAFSLTPACPRATPLQGSEWFTPWLLNTPVPPALPTVQAWCP